VGTVPERAKEPLDLVAGIYEAALEPAQWSDVLQSVQTSLGADSGALYLQDLQAMDASFQVSQGLDPARLQDYFHHYIRLNPSYVHRTTQPLGTVSASHLLVPDAQFAESEFYRDYLRHMGRFYSMGVHIAQDPGRVAVFTLQRARRRGPFGSDTQAALHGLVPHLRRAFQIGRQLAAAETERQAMLVLLERLPTGVILLDERGRAVFLNRRAEAVLAAGDGLLMTPQGLQAVAPDVQPLLERFIRNAVETGAGRATHAGGALTLPSAKGRESCQVLVTPLRMERVRVDVGRERICAALFLQLRDAQPALSVEVLRTLFGLTPAEARVAVALVHGHTPEEIATESETSRYTVRAQLSSIYEKLGVHRQAEVVQRVLNSPAALDDGKPHPRRRR
jgi:DNA-binding NarL/FixJ family response regulator